MWKNRVLSTVLERRHDAPIRSGVASFPHPGKLRRRQLLPQSHPRPQDATRNDIPATPPRQQCLIGTAFVVVDVVVASTSNGGIGIVQELMLFFRQ